jgi:dienelactone hydrolase
MRYFTPSVIAAKLSVLQIIFPLCLAFACLPESAAAGKIESGTTKCKVGERIKDSDTFGCTTRLPVGPPPGGGHGVPINPSDYGMCGILSLEGTFDNSSVARIIVGGDGYYATEIRWGSSTNKTGELPVLGWTCVRVAEFTGVPPASAMEAWVPPPTTTTTRSRLDDSGNACIWAGVTGGLSKPHQPFSRVEAEFSAGVTYAQAMGATEASLNSYAFCSGFNTKGWGGWIYYYSDLKGGEAGPIVNSRLTPAVSSNDYWCYVDMIQTSGPFKAEFIVPPGSDYVIKVISKGSSMAWNCLPFSQGAWVEAPPSRTAKESTEHVTLKGYIEAPGRTITFHAVDQNTGKLTPLSGKATSAASGSTHTTSSGHSYTLYPWSFDAGVLLSNFWAPQSIANGSDLASSQGHLEIFASAGGKNLYTFSHAALISFKASSEDPATAAAKYADGKSTVLFDQDGVGSGTATSWVNVQGMISKPLSPSYPSVAWSVGSYTVEGGKKIYGLICAPATGGPYPVLIYNHGGFGGIAGVVTSSGWTSPPLLPLATPDGLGQCLDWAKRGWVVAMSSYRGENVNITSASSAFPAPGTPWTSDGNLEFCMGEVTDVMALTDLVVNHAASITVGSTSEIVPLNVNGKVLMYGYSHGGCITYRAVEQGAPVTAFSVIEGFTDLNLNYLNWTSHGQPAWKAALAAGAFTLPTACTSGGGCYFPDANGVMGYNWRSAHYFASRGDLSIQKFKTMPILIFHGDVDMGNPVFFDEAAEIADDIGGTNIFVGTSGVIAPTSYACITGTIGAPIPASTISCPIAFTTVNLKSSCLTPTLISGQLVLPACSAVPLTPPQPHYMVVFHNMDHINGGLAIKATFDTFVMQTFGKQPGCDGLAADPCD